MKRAAVLYLLVFASFVACQSDRLDVSQAGAPVYLAAAVNESVSTRAPFVPKDENDNLIEAPSPKYPLNTDVWGSTTPYVFKEEYHENTLKPFDGSGSDGKVAIHTDATFQSGEPQLLRAAIYNKTTKPMVYFVAFSPMSGSNSSWTTDAGGTEASYVFGGNEDVMFAPQVAGQYAQDFNKSPMLHFSHLLTWLRVEFKAESKEVSESWGAIKSMTIRSKNKVTISLAENAYYNSDSAPLYNFTEEGNISYSNDIDMNFYKTIEEESYVGNTVKMVKNFTNTVFPSSDDANTIPYLMIKEMAYVLCAPVDGRGKIVVDGLDTDSYEYEIHLQTDKRTVTVPVDLKESSSTPFLGNTRGIQFTLTLNFKMGNTVYLTSSVSDWNVGGLLIGNFNDDNITVGD